MNTWITIALALLGGGGIWSIITTWAGFRESRKMRHKEYLEAQLQNFYSPLAFMCHKVEVHHESLKKFQSASRQYFESMDNIAREARPGLHQEIQEHIAYQNRYFTDITAMHQQAQNLIEQNFKWLDSSDVTEVMNFILHCARCKREHEEPNKVSSSYLRIPTTIYEEIGVPSLWLPSFSKLIMKRHQEKQQELEILHEGWISHTFKWISNFFRH